MKTTALAVVSPLGLLALALLGDADENKEAPRPVAIFKSKEPLKIDGALDEPAWKDALPIDVGYVWPKVGEKSKEPRMKAWYTWDDDYLYIGYETFDQNLVA